MKKIYMFLIGLMMIFSLNSCVGTSFATTQDDMYIETDVDIVHSTVDFNVVFRYGTPYYYNGSLLYYLYDGIYYYPYYYDNYWYLRAYRRPFPYTSYRPYFRPHRYDYRFHRDFRPRPYWYGHGNGNVHHIYGNTRRPDNRLGNRPDNRHNSGVRPSNPNPGMNRGGSTVRPNNTQPRMNPGTTRGTGSMNSRPNVGGGSRGGFNTGGSRSSGSFGGSRGGSMGGSRGGGRR